MKKKMQRVHTNFVSPYSKIRNIFYIDLSDKEYNNFIEEATCSCFKTHTIGLAIHALLGQWVATCSCYTT